tara:strand:- start:802 stop:1626 length:825 start_codon:yes stop_codon:yes gene_type:complete
VRVRHNKKRNTAFLYEVLVKELTKSIVEKRGKQKRFVSNLIKEAFGNDSLLRKELECYATLVETTDLELHVAAKLLHETKTAQSQLDGKRIFDAQTRIINKINKTLTQDAWDTFVPNFKSLATIASIFNPSTPVKQRVLQEDLLIKMMHSSQKIEENKLQSIDNIVYRSFVKKFNEQYTTLLAEQKDLLGKYIASFADNGLELKLYLNEEIGRLKKEINASLKMKEIYTDDTMIEKTTDVIGTLDSFRTAAPTKELISKVLRIQELVREIKSND